MTDLSGQMPSGRPSIVGRYPVAAGAVILVAAAFRLWLIELGLPRFDSDEGTMGLMALHIELHGARPIFFYGQAYMGSLEAYVGAGLFQLFGPSDATLRLGLLVLIVLFLGCAYTLARLLYGRTVALVALCLLAAGSRELLSRELKAVGGYPELLLFGTATLLAATILSLYPQARRRWGVYGFGVAGLLSGLGVWSDPLTLPFVAAALALLALTCRRELFGIPGLVLTLGLLVGLAPAIAYNTDPSVRQTTWGDVAQIVRAGGSGHVGSGSPPLGRRIAGAVAVSVPVMTGGMGLCRLQPQDAWPLSSRVSPRTIACTAVHAAWGSIFILMLLLAASLALIALFRSRRHPSAALGLERAGRDRALALAQLAPIAAAMGTLLLFAFSSAPARAPWYDVRYLTGLWIALPAIIALLIAPRGVRSLRFGRYLLLAVLVLAVTLDAVSTLGDREYTSWLQSQQSALASTLETHSVRHVYTDYWTCDWLAFETRERITCAVLNSRLQPSLDRYLPYRAAVRADHRAPYVFRSGTPEERAFSRLAHRYKGLYRVTKSSVFVIYWPV